ncbi:MAG: flagellar basal body-associated FliL family protein [Alphaproteobacteria bacterium]
MSEATADESVEDHVDELEDDLSEPSRSTGGKRQIIVAGVVALLLVGGAAGAHFGGLVELIGGFVGRGEDAPSVVYYDLPEMVVNLESGSKKKTFLKIQLSLELDDSENLSVLDRVLPRVVDQFHVYLRELRADDLHGSAGIYRLKEEMLRRVSAAAHPVRIRDVLFKEMLIQ